MSVTKIRLLLIFMMAWSSVASVESTTLVKTHDATSLAATDSMEVELLVEQADSLSALGNLQDEKKVLQQALQKANSLNNISLITSIQLDIAVNYINSDQPDSAEVLLTNMLGQRVNRVDSTRILNLLGVAYRYQGQFKKAFEKHALAINLIDSVAQQALFSKIKLNTAMLYNNRGEYGKAFKYFLSSIEAAEAAGDTTALTAALNSIGVAYNNYGQPEKAEYHLRRVIKIYRGQNDRLGLLRANNNLANSAKQSGKYTEAISLYERALELHEEVRSDVPPYRTLYNLGQLHKDTGELEKAEKYYQQSLAYCKKAGIFQGLIFNYGGLANVAELRNNYPKAREYYTRALDVSRQIGAGGLEKIALNSLYNLEKGLDNTAEALSYYEQYVALNDSLNAIAQEQALAETETKLNLRQQEEMNQLLQEKQEQQEARINAQDWLIFAGIAIIVVILVSLFLLYRSNEEKKKINAELQAKHKRLEELNKVKDKMLAIIAHDLRSPLSAMQGMLYLMQEGELSENETKQITTELNLSLNKSINMMDNLLIWARGQMSGLKINKTAVNPTVIARQVFQNYEISARQKGILLINEANEEHKPKADFDLLKLVVRNLVSNSIKFCEEGDAITVSTNKETDSVVFKVKDTGIGISDEARKKLFTSQSTSHMGTNNEKGSGLGLHLCKEFIEKQGGSMWVESREGEGTTMLFSLPEA